MLIDTSAPEGNAFCIMGVVQDLLKRSGREAEIPEAVKRMQSGDYKNLCAVATEVSYGSIEFYNSNEGEDE